MKFGNKATGGISVIAATFMLHCKLKNLPYDEQKVHENIKHYISNPFKKKLPKIKSSIFVNQVS